MLFQSRLSQWVSHPRWVVLKGFFSEWIVSEGYLRWGSLRVGSFGVGYLRVGHRRVASLRAVSLRVSYFSEWVVPETAVSLE